ncbi:MAG: metallophosphoesterase [Pseudomonadota bacterium]
MTLYAIGDIHGHLDKLDRALSLVEADGGASARIVFLGDYVDRGPESKGVIARLADGLDAGRPWTCLKGNHDRIMEWFFEDEPRQDPHMMIEYHWCHEMIGGRETLASYGVTVPEKIRLSELHERALPALPDRHLAFLRGLDLYHEAGRYLFVHAGIRPGQPLAAQTQEDMVWIRQPFLSHGGPHPWIVVHGHTAIESPTHYRNRINVDGGAAYGNALVPVALEEDGSAFALTEEGRRPMAPRDNRPS